MKNITHYFLLGDFHPDKTEFHSYLSAYRRVFRVCSVAMWLGEIFAIIHVLELPMNESFSTWGSKEKKNLGS